MAIKVPASTKVIVRTEMFELSTLSKD